MKSNTFVLGSNPWVKWYLLGFFVLVALPLLNLPPWFAPPDWGKVIVFRITGSLLMFLFLWQFLWQKLPDYSYLAVKLLTRSPLFWLLIALLAFFFLATLFSLDRTFSLWGSPPRSGGFVNFAFYIILAIVAVILFQAKEWRSLWDVAIGTGILVSLVALLQQFGIFRGILIPQATQLGSTIGGPMFFGVYLILLSFLALGLGLGSEGKIRKWFYLGSFMFFTIILILVASQAAYIGFAVGILWFLFLYLKKLPHLGVGFAVLILLGVSGAYFLKTNPNFPLSQNFIVQQFISWQVDQSRLSAWKVGWEAIKARPLFGYGPENFAIGFDRFYNPALPSIAKDPSAKTSWWDRAHNFALEIAATAGIPALLIYLALFAAVLSALQKLKRDPEKKILSHGIQAALLGYLSANFFGIDTYSSYLISFLFIGYTLSLTNATALKASQTILLRKPRTSPMFGFLKKWRVPVFVGLAITLLLFNWQYAIKPFQVNTKINAAKYLAEKNQCIEAFEILGKARTQGKTFLDTYLRLKFVDYLRTCASTLAENDLLELTKVGYALLKENTTEFPYYTRNWIFLAGLTNILIERAQAGKLPDTPREKIPELISEALSYSQEAQKLSPKHQELYAEWIKTYLLAKQYQKAKELAQTCIDLNPKLGDCWWLKGLSEAFAGELNDSKNDIGKAKELGYPTETLIAYNQLVKAYTASKSYQQLAEVYEKIIEKKPDDPQYHASLATTYKELGQFEKAKREALKVFELQPATKSLVEEFLRSLPRDPALYIAWVQSYLNVGEYKEAKTLGEECTRQYPEFKDCWWQKALTEAYLGEIENAKRDIEIATQYGYPTRTYIALEELAEGYTVSRSYRELAQTYEQLVALYPAHAQYRFSLAKTYKELGEFPKARQQALQALELNVNAKDEIEAFLRTLP